MQDIYFNDDDFDIFINDILSDIDFKGDNWSKKQIVEALRTKLNHEPSISIEYGKDVLFSEGEKKATEIVTPCAIEIVYEDFMTKQIKRKKYLL